MHQEIALAVALMRISRDKKGNQNQEANPFPVSLLQSNNLFHSFNTFILTYIAIEKYQIRTVEWRSTNDRTMAARKSWTFIFEALLARKRIWAFTREICNK